MIKNSCSISLWKWSAISAVGLFFVGCSQNQESIDPVFTQEETEIDVLCGQVVARGEKLGVPTPLNSMLLSQIKALR